MMFLAVKFYYNISLVYELNNVGVRGSNKTFAGPSQSHLHDGAPC